MSVSQNEFNALVRRYNEDYIFWLDCVASGDFDRATNVLLTLKDSYEAIIETCRLLNLRLETNLYPFPLENEKVEFHGFDLKLNELDQISFFLKTVKNMPIFREFGRKLKSETFYSSSRQKEINGLLP